MNKFERIQLLPFLLLILAACNSTPRPVQPVISIPDAVVAIDPPGDTSALYVYLPLTSDLKRVTTYRQNE